MSSVRMCDKCATVFSELADGWQTYSATTIKKDPDTLKRETVTLQLDACPACAMDVNEPPSVQRADDTFFERKRLELENAELRGRLEREHDGETVAAEPAPVDDPEPGPAA